eukprot:960525-Pyramimonas_sp.AAC.1
MSSQKSRCTSAMSEACEDGPSCADTCDKDHPFGLAQECTASCVELSDCLSHFTIPCTRPLAQAFSTKEARCPRPSAKALRSIAQYLGGRAKMHARK